MIGAPEVCLEVSRLHKSFRLPVSRPTTLKERAVHPFQRTEFQELKVLDDVSFQVRQGEFFGIVGRNGSGKSTLLKLLASVYRADSGRIRVAGLLAPIIELGVGFEPELSARGNVVLNGLMMGLTAREAKRRFDAVIEFAELEDFTELKLSNYSSGMKVRLAFAVMIQTDPDVILLDEVLAVGDLAFQLRCEAVFDEFRRRGEKTVVLVTHQMETVEDYCDRAIFLERGRIEETGPAAEVASFYEAKLESKEDSAPPPVEEPRRPVAPVRISDARLDYREGSDPTGRPDLVFSASIEAEQVVEEPRLLLYLTNESGIRVFASPWVDFGSAAGGLAAGERVTVRTIVEDKLPSGDYVAACIVATGPMDEAAISPPANINFTVPGTNEAATGGVVNLDYDVEIEHDASTEHETRPVS